MSAVPPVIFSNKAHLVDVSANPESPTAPPGMAFLVACRTHALIASTGVLSVNPGLIMPNNAPSVHSFFVINTTFISEIWLATLINMPVFDKFQDIPIGILFRFDMEITSPFYFTYKPPNYNSALLYPNHVLAHIKNELIN
jgi:hypothetical protein